MDVLFPTLSKSISDHVTNGVENPQTASAVKAAFEALSPEDKAMIDQSGINWPVVFAKALAAGRLARDVVREVRGLR